MADEQPPGNQEGADTRPDWLEGNFTSVEAQAKAYADARAEMHRQQARAQELEQQAAQWQDYAAELEAQSQQPQQQPQFGQDNMSNPLLLQLRQAREMGDDMTELALTAHIANTIAEQKINEFKAAAQGQQPQTDQTQTEMYAMWADNVARERYDAQYGHGAWDETRRDAAEFLAANPDLIPEDTPPSVAAQRLVMAAEYVQGRKFLTASEQERNQMVEARARRIQAGTLTPGGTPPPTQETAEEAWERIKNAPAGDYASLRGSI